MSYFRAVILDERDRVVTVEEMTDEGLKQAEFLAHQLAEVLAEEVQQRRDAEVAEEE